MAWRPGGDEVLFSAYDSSNGYVVRGLTVGGRLRVAVTGAGLLTAQDVSRERAGAPDPR